MYYELNRSNRNIHQFFCILFCTVCFVVFNNSTSVAQKYAFSHYDIEDGLIQSQANKLCQDNQHRLWIATFGGVCRFDGKEYYSISKANGLLNNTVISIHADKKGLVWFGTDRGLLCLENQKIYYYPIPKGYERTLVTKIGEDVNGNIWAIMGFNLFKVHNHHMMMVTPTEGSENGITGLSADASGKLYISVYGKGLYILNKDKWVPYLAFPKGLSISPVSRIVFDRSDPQKKYLLTRSALWVITGSAMAPLEPNLLKDIKDPYLSLEQDEEGNLWIGTSYGAYRLCDHKLTHFTERNGLTNNAVVDIYNDRDNNLWLATSGNGFFKYEHNNYVTYDQSQGIKNNQVIMAIAHDRNKDVILGTDGGGLIKLKGDSMINLSLPTAYMGAKRIDCLFKDSKGDLWVGTERSGIWKYNGDKFSLIKGTENNSVVGMDEDSRGAYYFATPRGCYYYMNDTLKRMEGVSGFVSSVLVVGKDSVLIGSLQGLSMAVNEKVAAGFTLPALGRSAIYCMLKIKDLVLFGTDDKGVFVWNKRTGKIKNYNVKDGLSSYMIYSLAVTKNGTVWAGTSRGVNRILLDPKTLNCTILNDGNAKGPIVETNQNAILADGNRVLIGTTKGLKVYNTGILPSPQTAPYIILRSVRLFNNDGNQSQDITAAKPGGTKLSSSQNHIAITFLGVYLKNPDNVSYQYRLTGLDNKFSAPVKNNVVDYPSLPPGKYTFEVKALADNGRISQNTARFSFEIVPPFYKTLIFQGGVGVFFVLLLIGLQNFFHQRKLKNLQAIEAMKREEKIKIRQQTAEDFHDDLGNKLTRITVLTEILNAKIDLGQTDQRNLVEQIKQNASALYNGTKDILWALDPKSDNLYEMLMHIKEIGTELFQDTPVIFRCGEMGDNLKDVKLSMEQNRNITMIFKELVNNIIKHAAAAEVVLEVKKANGEVVLSLTDDGKGFEQDKIKKGYGINNIRSRAKRINGEISIFSKAGIGTTVELKFKRSSVS